MANYEVGNLAGRARKEEFDIIQPEPVDPHCRYSTALQTILPDGSISGNLARKIPDAITTIRGKQQMKRTLNMIEERMAMIDEEITASNARKFGTSSSARAHISKQYTHQWYTEEFQTSSMIEYQQRVDPATTEKTRRFYTLCDVQAGRRFTKNTSNPSDENE